MTQSGHSGSHPITEHASREADQDWSQDRPPGSISHVPIGRGRVAEGTVPEYPEPDRLSTTNPRSGADWENRQLGESDRRGVSEWRKMWANGLREVPPVHP